MMRRALDILYRTQLGSRAGVCLGEQVRVMGRPLVGVEAGGRLSIGDRSCLISRAADTALGTSHPCVLRVAKPAAELVIGADCGLSGVTIVASESITIGEQCLLGANVMVIDSDFHALSPTNRRYSKEGIATAPVVIGANVFIGANAMVLKGVTIGADSVVGAGSVVTSDVPDRSIVAGNPATLIGQVQS